MTGNRLYGIFIASTGDKTHVYPLLRAMDIVSYFTAVYCGEADKVAMLGRAITPPKADWIMVGDMEILFIKKEPGIIPALPRK